MPPHEPPPEVREAFATVMGWLVRAFMVTAAEHVKPSGEHYTAKTAPMPPCTFRKACRKGVFTRASCAGGEWRAPKDEVDAWLATQPKPRATAKPSATNAAPTTARTGEELHAELFGALGQTTPRKGKRS